MLKVTRPIVTSEIIYDKWMSFVNAFITAMSELHIKQNDAYLYISSAENTFVDHYQLESAIYLKPTSTSSTIGFEYGLDANTCNTGDGCVISILPTFLDTNLQILSTNRFYTDQIQYGLGFSTVDIANGYGYGFSPKTSTLDQNALSFIMPSDTNMDDVVCLSYNNDDTAFISIYDYTNYMIFTRLKPIDPNDDPLYAIITRIQNHPNKAIYIITKDQTYEGEPFMEPLSIISSDLHIANKESNDVTIDKFIFDDRWYSDDLYVINYIESDHITILDGAQYVPLGFNLFLRAK